MATAPEFLICIECETPCYTFEWQSDQITEIQCLACGNDDPEQFLLQDEMDALSGGH
ncbi:MAG: hypothetical protein AAGD01_16480 [Acidobacteriota bacterium]